ncbi:PIN domain-containing protein [Spirulina major CS-329]|uniref:PIN domain-containing protein n=1 Tax=Spirulina TaxID=1154 RepID=UPI00232A8950|nr:MULTISPECIES: PIN domain-containing protein [Spirulina]MDB9494562.1 PIN domain-containing protein [Spirulina subsalsa CS-330]MDB9503996.1 PIN domain-containing protein [Spirulina major CS-329]
MMLENNQPTDHISTEVGRVLLIDLENCPHQIYQLQENLEQFSQVVICYAQSGAKIPLDWLIPLSTMINCNKLKILKMATTGKNSADFGICFFAGVLMQQLPKDTHFVIISNDTDLDHAVNLLQSQGRSAERIGTQKEEESPAKSTPNKSEDIDSSRVKLYCIHLIKYSKNRPTKQETLLNSIKTKFQDSPGEVAEVFNVLKIQGAVKILEGKVLYNDKKIQELAGES